MDTIKNVALGLLGVGLIVLIIWAIMQAVQSPAMCSIISTMTICK